jgi:uncharacterized protein DUF3106
MGTRILSPALAALVIVLSLTAVRPASAQGDVSPEDLRARIERVKTMSPEERAELKQALKRFRKLPATERKALRAKARTVGADKLQALNGRDVKKLRRGHKQVRRETTEMLELLQFEQRSNEAGLRRDERRFLEHQLVRGFHRHVNQHLLAPHGEPFDQRRLEKLSPEERRAEYRGRYAQAVLEQMAEEERAAFASATPREQRRMKAATIAAFRDRQVIVFVRSFDEMTFSRWLRTPREVRMKRAQKFTERSRWFEIARRFDKELGVGRDALKLMQRLPADDWSRLRDEYEQSNGKLDTARKLAIEELIQRLHDKAAQDRQPRLRQRHRRRRKPKDGTAPPRDG